MWHGIGCSPHLAPWLWYFSEVMYPTPCYSVYKGLASLLVWVQTEDDKEQSHEGIQQETSLSLAQPVLRYTVYELTLLHLFIVAESAFQ